MKQLAALQRAFQRHVYLPARAMEHDVLGTPRANAARRLSIYAGGYRSRLVEALGSDYPALQALLGEDGFDGLMREFIAAHPSRFANLRWYGGELARFLALTPRWRRRPLLAELAAFEWALGLAFDAADAPLLDADDIARVPAQDWPEMRFGLHPSAQRLELRSNTPQVWQSLLVRKKKRTPQARLRRIPVAWLIWRKDHTPFYRALAEDEAWALRAVERGRNFGTLCAGLRRFAGDTQAAQRGAQLLRNWITEELICASQPIR